MDKIYVLCESYRDSDGIEHYSPISASYDLDKVKAEMKKNANEDEFFKKNSIAEDLSDEFTLCSLSDNSDGCYVEYKIHQTTII